MNEIESKYLLRVLTKPELGDSIVLQELIQIMENLGLYEDDSDEEGGQEEEELKNEDELEQSVNEAPLAPYSGRDDE